MSRINEPFKPAISDEIWEAVSAKLARAIRKDSARDFLEALAYRSRTKCTWRELPESFGRWHKIYVRFAHWDEKGHFKKMRKLMAQHGVAIGQARADAFNAKHAQARAAAERRSQAAADGGEQEATLKKAPAKAKARA